MYKKQTNHILLVFLLLLFISCVTEIEEDPNLQLFGTNFGKLDEVELRKEISLLMGNVFLDKESRDYALNYARFKNDNSESISLAALAGNESNIAFRSFSSSGIRFIKHGLD